MNPAMNGNQMMITRTARVVGKFVPEKLMFVTDELKGVLSGDIDPDQAKAEGMSEHDELDV